LDVVTLTQAELVTALAAAENVGGAAATAGGPPVALVANADLDEATRNAANKLI